MTQENLCAKKYRKGMKRIGVVYPGTYDLALSSLVFHQLYYMLCNIEDVFVERIVREDNRYSSLDTGSDPLDLDILLIPIHYELDYKELPLIMRYKKPEEVKPLIIVGGPPVTANPLSLKGLADAAVIGEAEPFIECLKDILLVLAGKSKDSALEALAGCKGVFVYKYSRRVTKTYVEDLDNAFYSIRQLQSVEAKPLWGRTLLVEVSRGCPRQCRFCMESYITKPWRGRSFKTLTNIIEKGVSENQVDKITFLALSFFDHPESIHILEFSRNLSLKYSLPSLCMATLDEYKLRLVREGGQRTVSLAPETGSERLARAISKYIPLDFIEDTVRKAIDLDFSSIKLYIMTGFYGEEKRDVDDTILLIKRLARITREKGKELRVTVNPFMPKPYTPLQWLPFRGHRGLARLFNYIRSQLAGLYGRLSFYDPRRAAIQVALSRCSHGCADLVRKWSLYGGGLAAWRRAVRETGFGLDKLLGKLDEIPRWHEYADLYPVNHKLLRRGLEDYLSTIGVELNG